MKGFGGVVTFEVKGGIEAGSRLVDACKIARIAPSLGGVETLIEQPALMSFYELTTEQRLAVGIKDELVRLAVGIEDTDELIADLKAALEAAHPELQGAGVVDPRANFIVDAFTPTERPPFAGEVRANRSEAESKGQARVDSPTKHLGGETSATTVGRLTDSTPPAAPLTVNGFAHV